MAYPFRKIFLDGSFYTGKTVDEYIARAHLKVDSARGAEYRGKRRAVTKPGNFS